MLDISYVYMDIYLPTLEAGQVKIGADARIVLDAYPDIADPGEGRPSSPARRSSRPKTVETQNERDKLMFRVRVRIDPERCARARDVGAQRAAGRRLRPHRSGGGLAAATCKGRRE